ncbi:MAG: hypothetical protein KJO63_03915 [Maribacter sp.]|nr:hypothetical protein [Maribacter sp.]NNK19024.1 hypothetical protein [Maribacter sp.]
MKKYLIGILSFCLTLLSCNNHEFTDIEIINRTGDSIDSLIIGKKDDSYGKYVSLNKDESIIYKVDLSDFSRNDSSYVISYRQKNKTVAMPFIYYKNGTPTDELLTIRILKDSISMDIEF